MAPIALPNTSLELAAIQAIGSQGFAVAYSLDAENGWAVKNRAQTTHQFRDLFAKTVGTPVLTYLVGTSEGGLMTLNLAERFAGQHDGALSVCCVVSGATTAFHHAGDGRVLFDYFFTSVLPATLDSLPPSNGRN
jgi:hypothetical protein